MLNFQVSHPVVLYRITNVGTLTVKHILTFTCPCNLNIIPNYNQQDATFLDLFISTDALHVSGGSSAHHQEHITVHTASGIVSQYCCLMQHITVHTASGIVSQY